MEEHITLILFEGGWESRVARIEASIAAIPDENTLVAVVVSFVEEERGEGEGTLLYSRDEMADSRAERVGLSVRP